jgi:hypothetical protein
MGSPFPHKAAAISLAVYFPKSRRWIHSPETAFTFQAIEEEK